jgi:electron transport complex protein RnfB
MDGYEQLREVLDSHPATAPKSKVIIEILKTLFTPDEAAVAITMSFKPGSIEKIAAACSLSPREAETRLESMANKGIVFSKRKADKTLYGLVPLARSSHR